MQEQLQELKVHQKSLDKLERLMLVPATHPRGEHGIAIPQPLEQLATFLASQRDRLVERQAKLDHEHNLIVSKQAEPKKAAADKADKKPAVSGSRRQSWICSLRAKADVNFRCLVKQASWKPAYRLPMEKLRFPRPVSNPRL